MKQEIINFVQVSIVMIWRKSGSKIEEQKQLIWTGCVVIKYETEYHKISIVIRNIVKSKIDRMKASYAFSTNNDFLYLLLSMPVGE